MTFSFTMNTIVASPLLDYSNQIRSKCPTTSTCSCANSVLEYEITCPQAEPTIVVKVEPGKTVQIDCLIRDETVFAKLPEMTIGDVHQVVFRRCPLPLGSSIHRILEHLGIRRITFLNFMNYGADRGTITRQHLTGLPELSRLMLSGGLENLPEDLFDDVGNLTWLNLHRNKLHLPANIFRNLHKLEYLELGYNYMDKLENGVFRNQHNLKFLNLLGNNFQKLTKEAFRGVTSIVDLDLSGNNIELFESDVFEHLTSLANINLNANRFTSLPMGLFSKNKDLKQIRLMNNRVDLETLPSGFLADLPVLEEVSIRCNLRSVPSDMFKDSPNIKNITMSENALSTLPNGLFEDQSMLLDLDLSDNQLYELPDNLLGNTDSIIVLRLSNNQLNRISG